MKKTITIVGFGDSITEAKIRVEEDQRWLNVLAQKLKAAFPDRAFNVINSGVGGNSAREAMARFDKAVLTHDPDYVLLEFGGNNNDPTKPERRVPPDEFKALLERFRTSLPAKTGVIVITFPPVIWESHAYWKNPAYRDYLQKSEKEGMSLDNYVSITREFARKNAFPIYDLNAELTALGERDGRQTYTLDDGVHLTPAGNRVLAEGAFRVLREKIAPAAR